MCIRDRHSMPNPAAPWLTQLGGFAVDTAWSLGNYVAEKSSGTSLPSFLVGLLREFVLLDDNDISFNPINIEATGIVLTEKTVDLIYQATGLHIDASVGHLHVTLLLDTTNPIAVGDIPVAFFDAHEDPVHTGRFTVLEGELSLLRIVASGLLIELVEVHFQMSCENFDQWYEHRELRTSLGGASGEARASSRTVNALLADRIKTTLVSPIQNQVGKVLSASVLDNLHAHLQGLNLVFHGAKNKLVEILPFTGAGGIQLDALWVVSQGYHQDLDELPAGHDGGGWSQFLDHVTNIPLQGGLGETEAYLLDTNCRDKILQVQLLVSKIPVDWSFFSSGSKHTCCSLQFQMEHRSWEVFQVEIGLHELHVVAGSQVIVGRAGDSAELESPLATLLFSSLDCFQSEEAVNTTVEGENLKRRIKRAMEASDLRQAHQLLDSMLYLRNKRLANAELEDLPKLTAVLDSLQVFVVPEIIGNVIKTIVGSIVKPRSPLLPPHGHDVNTELLQGWEMVSERLQFEGGRVECTQCHFEGQEEEIWAHHTHEFCECHEKAIQSGLGVPDIDSFSMALGTQPNWRITTVHDREVKQLPDFEPPSLPFCVPFALDLKLRSPRLTLPVEAIHDLWSFDYEALHLSLGVIEAQSIGPRKLEITLAPDGTFNPKSSFCSISWKDLTLNKLRHSSVLDNSNSKDSQSLDEVQPLRAMLLFVEENQARTVRISVAAPGLNGHIDRLWTPTVFRLKSTVLAAIEDDKVTAITIDGGLWVAQATMSHFHKRLIMRSSTTELPCTTVVDFEFPVQILCHGHGIGCGGDLGDDHAGKIWICAGMQLVAVDGLIEIEVPQLLGSMSMGFILYLVAVAEVASGRRELNTLPETNGDLERETQHDDSTGINPLALFEESTVFTAELPDPKLPAVDENHAKVTIRIEKGKNTDIVIDVPTLEAHASFNGDIELHITDATIEIEDFKSSADYVLAVATNTLATHSPMLGVTAFVKQITIHSEYTWSRQKGAWLMLQADPSTPLITHLARHNLGKPQHKDSELSLELSKCVVEVSWSLVVLKQAIDAINGMVKFTFPESEDDIQAKLDDLDLNIVNLMPTMSIFNRTTEVISCAGQFNSTWPWYRQAGWMVAFAVWFINTFDMVLSGVGSSMLVAISLSVDCAMTEANIGPCVTDRFFNNGILPLILWNLFMPAFLHALLGYYEKRYATLSGIMTCVGLFYIVFKTNEADWENQHKPEGPLIVMALTVASRILVSLISLLRRYSFRTKQELKSQYDHPSNLHLSIRVPWHHRAQAFWLVTGIVLWIALGGLIRENEARHPLCPVGDSMSACGWSWISWVSVMFRLFFGLLTLLWSLTHVIISLRQNKLVVGPLSASMHDMAETPGEDDAQDSTILFQPLVDKGTVGFLGSNKHGFSWFGWNLITGVSLFLAGDLAFGSLAAVNIFLLDDMDDTNDYYCNECQIVWLHAVSTLMAVPYVLLYMFSYLVYDRKMILNKDDHEFQRANNSGFMSGKWWKRQGNL
eukprot:TRINITY_DN13201_c0_g1_i2.p1 TRINITY_DN13201_c0_g1~~TRINITY_DN13201_c0_g1_i2.p1  ORF type:complete len:1514 (-),score=302.71 TRINITY_DN13201_c0_g1_i2:260-4801(-)